MRKLILCAIGLAGMAGAWSFPSVVYGQGAGAEAAEAAPTAQRIALIDMGVVFKEYEKFKRLRDDLKQELDEKEAEAKAMFGQIQSITAVLKNGALKQGSPEYLEKEKTLTQLMANLEAHKKQAQLALSRKEAGIYHQVNLEINDMVARVAKKYKYTLVMRFSREDLSSSDPQKVAQGLSRQILYFEKSDDISDTVVHYLNHFDKQKNPVRTTSNEKPARKAKPAQPEE